MNPIIYGADETNGYAFLSNDYPRVSKEAHAATIAKFAIRDHAITVDEDNHVTYFPTLTHYYHYFTLCGLDIRLFGVVDYAEKILSLDTPDKVRHAATMEEYLRFYGKKLTKERYTRVIADFNKVRSAIIDRGLALKFSDEAMKEALLSTGGSVLQENKGEDPFFAQRLMNCRENIQKKSVIVVEEEPLPPEVEEAQFIHDNEIGGDDISIDDEDFEAEERDDVERGDKIDEDNEADDGGDSRDAEEEVEDKPAESPGNLKINDSVVYQELDKKGKMKIRRGRIIRIDLKPDDIEFSIQRFKNGEVVIVKSSETEFRREMVDLARYTMGTLVYFKDEEGKKIQGIIVQRKADVYNPDLYTVKTEDGKEYKDVHYSKISLESDSKRAPYKFGQYVRFSYFKGDDNSGRDEDKVVSEGLIVLVNTKSKTVTISEAETGEKFEFPFSYQDIELAEIPKEKKDVLREKIAQRLADEEIQKRNKAKLPPRKRTKKMEKKFVRYKGYWGRGQDNVLIEPDSEMEKKLAKQLKEIDKGDDEKVMNMRPRRPKKYQYETRNVNLFNAIGYHNDIHIGMYPWPNVDINQLSYKVGDHVLFMYHDSSRKVKAKLGVPITPVEEKLENGTTLTGVIYDIYVAPSKKDNIEPKRYYVICRDRSLVVSDEEKQEDYGYIYFDFDLPTREEVAQRMKIRLDPVYRETEEKRQRYDVQPKRPEIEYLVKRANARDMHAPDIVIRAKQYWPRQKDDPQTFLSIHATMDGRQRLAQHLKHFRLPMTLEQLCQKQDEEIFEVLRQSKPRDNEFDRNTHKADQIIKFMTAEGINVPPASKYLDFGCNDGHIAAIIATKLDLIPLGCDIIPQRDVCIQYVSTLDHVDTHTISLLTSNMVLHHVDDMIRAVESMNRVVKKGGYVVIEEHNVPKNNATLMKFLDVVHDIFSFVLTEEEKKCVEFAHGRTHGDYRSMDFFIALFELKGFKLVATQNFSKKTKWGDTQSDITANPQNKFIAAFRKVKDLDVIMYHKAHIGAIPPRQKHDADQSIKNLAIENIKNKRVLLAKDLDEVLQIDLSIRGAAITYLTSQLVDNFFSFDPRKTLLEEYDMSQPYDTFVQNTLFNIKYEMYAKQIEASIDQKEIDALATERYLQHGVVAQIQSLKNRTPHFFDLHYDDMLKFLDSIIVPTPIEAAIQAKLRRDAPSLRGRDPNKHISRAMQHAVLTDAINDFINATNVAAYQDIRAEIKDNKIIEMVRNIEPSEADRAIIDAKLEQAKEKFLIEQKEIRDAIPRQLALIDLFGEWEADQEFRVNYRKVEEAHRRKETERGERERQTLELVMRNKAREMEDQVITLLGVDSLRFSSYLSHLLTPLIFLPKGPLGSKAKYLNANIKAGRIDIETLPTLTLDSLFPELFFGRTDEEVQAERTNLGKLLFYEIDKFFAYLVDINLTDDREPTLSVYNTYERIIKKEQEDIVASIQNLRKPQDVCKESTKTGYDEKGQEIDDQYLVMDVYTEADEKGQQRTYYSCHDIRDVYKMFIEEGDYTNPHSGTSHSQTFIDNVMSRWRKETRQQQQ